MEHLKKPKEKVIRTNYQGDTGAHVAKWLWCYTKYHSKAKLVNDEAQIASIYVDAVKRLEKSPRFQNEVEEINRRLALGVDNKLNNLWNETRKYSLEALEKMLSPEATVVRNGRIERIPANELVPGDIIKIEAGDRIPADARIIENIDLRINEAALTGESHPVGKNDLGSD